MAKNYRELLEAQGITSKDVSGSIKKLIGEYDQIEKFIETGNAKLASGKLNDAKKTELESDLAEAATSLEEANTYIVDAITAWLPKREANKAKGEALAAARKNKKGATTAAATDSTATKKEEKPAATQSVATDEGKTKKTSATTETTAKKGVSWGAILGIGLTIALGLAGLGYYEYNKNKAA
jgi:predicted flap endonuclease-1-like 5' DNA nuclease